MAKPTPKKRDLNRVLAALPPSAYRRIETKLEVAPHLQSLFRYLVENQFIQEITDYDPANLRIHPPEVLAQLQSGDPAWETAVPPEVAEVIKSRQFFGYRAPATG